VTETTPGSVDFDEPIWAAICRHDVVDDKAALLRGLERRLEFVGFE